MSYARDGEYCGNFIRKISRYISLRAHAKLEREKQNFLIERQSKS